MTAEPENFAERPDDDALSEVLHTVRLRGDAVLRCAPPVPFAITIPERVRVVHLVEQGDVRLRVPGQEPVTLVSGDMVLLARGDAHQLEAGPRVAARPLREDDRYRPESPDGPRWVTGTFAVEDAVAGPLLAVLPPSIVVRAGSDGTGWLGLSTRALVLEMTGPRPGSSVMVSRILDLLFIQALRVWAAGDGAAPGWLTAAMDPDVGRALVAIHRDLCRSWSVAELAAAARLSRSVFAARFSRLLGTSPAAYLTERRLERAAELLRTTATPVSVLADQVGYRSEAAFSRAFHRRFGMPPLRWRKTSPSVAVLGHP